MKDEYYYDCLNWISARVSFLRVAKKVSAREMSLALGQNENYINRIENKKTFPSLPGLLYICQYFGITFSEFFDDAEVIPEAMRQVNADLRKLTPEQFNSIAGIIHDLANK
ncbi:MAG: helix-turn-helix transcriptional regulator [Clostridia bacterium]|nr:helix-turn-helix transcriptional regulator [Clostridia bacterium]